MKKIIILGTDTLHRRFFIKSLLKTGFPIDSIVFEKDIISPPFPTGPFFEDEEKNFELSNFFSSFSQQINEIEVKYVNNINDNESNLYINSRGADLAIIFGTRKISQNILKLFPDGAINIHRGIAEEYRGMDTNLWAIYHMDFINTGVTIHYANEKLDTGNIIYQERIVYPNNVKVFELRYYESLLCVELVEKTLIQYLSSSIFNRKQSKTGRYYSFMPLVLKQLLPKILKNYPNGKKY